MDTLPAEIIRKIACTTQSLKDVLSLAASCKYCNQILQEPSFIIEFLITNCKELESQITLNVSIGRFDQFWLGTWLRNPKNSISDINIDRLEVIDSVENVIKKRLGPDLKDRRPIIIHWTNNIDNFEDKITIYSFSVDIIGRVATEIMEINETEQMTYLKRHLNSQPCIEEAVNQFASRVVTFSQSDTSFLPNISNAIIIRNRNLQSNNVIQGTRSIVSPQPHGHVEEQEPKYKNIFNSIHLHREISKVFFNDWSDWHTFTLPTGQKLKITIANKAIPIRQPRLVRRRVNQQNVPIMMNLNNWWNHDSIWNPIAEDKLIITNDIMRNFHSSKGQLKLIHRWLLGYLYVHR